MKELKALIVEDDLVSSRILELIFKKNEITTVANLSSADQILELISSHAPDFIIMDVMIEGDIDGVEAAEKIRQISNVFIMFLTGQEDPNTVSRIGRISNSQLILKPYLHREIIATIKSELL
ncbi:MAG: response regulator [Cyclobacteriaceae bacterium]